MTYSNGGFWRRVLAYIIDAIILSIGNGILTSVLFGSAAGLQAMMPGDEPSALFAGTFLTIQALGIVINWLYFAILESSSLQGTLGKRALGMIVTDLDGHRIGFGRATGRYFAKFLSALILFVGFVMVAFTQRKQGLHDIIAGTLVYKANPSDMVEDSASIFA